MQDGIQVTEVKTGKVTLSKVSKDPLKAFDAQVQRFSRGGGIAKTQYRIEAFQGGKVVKSWGARKNGGSMFKKNQRVQTKKGATGVVLSVGRGECTVRWDRSGKTGKIKTSALSVAGKAEKRRKSKAKRPQTRSIYKTSKRSMSAKRSARKSNPGRKSRKQSGASQKPTIAAGMNMQSGPDLFAAARTLLK